MHEQRVPRAAAIQVRVPTSGDEIEQVRALIRAFVAWHRERHQLDLSLIDSYFDAAAFEEELASLPGKYGAGGSSGWSSGSAARR